MISDTLEMLFDWWPLFIGLSFVFLLGLITGRWTKTAPAYRKGLADMERLIRDQHVVDHRSKRSIEQNFRRIYPR